MGMCLKRKDGHNTLQRQYYTRSYSSALSIEIFKGTPQRQRKNDHKKDSSNFLTFAYDTSSHGHLEQKVCITYNYLLPAPSPTFIEFWDSQQGVHRNSTTSVTPSHYSWIGPLVYTHDKSICQRTKRATTNPRPPLESSRQGEFRPAGTIFV